MHDHNCVQKSICDYYIQSQSIRPIENSAVLWLIEIVVDGQNILCIPADSYDLTDST